MREGIADTIIKDRKGGGMRRILICVLLVVPAVVGAQTRRFEVTPAFGYRWGGDVNLYERAITFQDYDLSMSASGTYGVRFGYALTPTVILEATASRQDTQWKDNQSLFGEVPGGFVEPGDTGVLDVDVTYYHLGVAFDIGRAATRGFMLASAGVAHVNAALPLPSDTRLSASVGGGLKMNLSERFALRFEGRYFWTDTDPAASATYSFANQDCQAPCSYTYQYKQSLDQFEATVGFVFRF
ncbi:MAG: outer membrane beta-barrel protein [Acidobacteriota bacterium]